MPVLVLPINMYDSWHVHARSYVHLLVLTSKHAQPIFIFWPARLTNLFAVIIGAVAMHNHTLHIRCDVQVPRMLQMHSSELSNEVSTCQQTPTTPLAMPILGSHARLAEGQTTHQHETLEACQVVTAAVAMASLDGNSNQQAHVSGQPISTSHTIALAATHLLHQTDSAVNVH